MAEIQLDENGICFLILFCLVEIFIEATVKAF
jgi:hypothetical protein